MSFEVRISQNPEKCMVKNDVEKCRFYDDPERLSKRPQFHKNPEIAKNVI